MQLFHKSQRQTRDKKLLHDREHLKRLKKFKKEFKSLEKEGKIPLDYGLPGKLPPGYKLPRQVLLERMNFKAFPVLSLISLAVLLVLFTLYYRTNIEVLVVLGVFGSSFFFPLGLACGWLFMDPFMRAVVLRKLFKKNYGIVFLVAKGRQIIPVIKNLDGSLIWHKENLWHISLKRVFMLRKPIEGGDYHLTDRNILLMGGIPTLFLDYSTMKPLDFWKEDTKIEPQEIAPAILGWVQNQKNKAMVFGKKMQLFNAVIIILIAVNLFLAYRTYTILNAMGGG